MSKGFAGKVNLDYAQDVDDLIKIIQEYHFLKILCWSKHEAEERVYDEITMTREANFAKGIQNHYDIRNKSILDVVCGLGGFVVQLGLNGAKVIGVEPGREYSIITQKRIVKYGLKKQCQCAAGQGEFLPFLDDKFDYVISLSTLEHVKNPELVLNEIVRVTKPGGFIFIEAENYFSFWDAHYRILWFPLMPKKLARSYLRLRGRDPYFFENHITYTTFLSLHRHIKKLNNVRDANRDTIKKKLQNPESIQSPLKRFVVNTSKVLMLNRALFLQLIYRMIFFRNIMKRSVTFNLKKVN